MSKLESWGKVLIVAINILAWVLTIIVIRLGNPIAIFLCVLTSINATANAVNYCLKY